MSWTKTETGEYDEKIFGENMISENVFKCRRNFFLEKIRGEKIASNKGVILLFGSFESERYRFWPDSSFFYLTGIEEPAGVFGLFFDETSHREVLYVPNFGGVRRKWVDGVVDIQSSTDTLGLDQIKHLGKQIKGFSCPPVFKKDVYADLLNDLKNSVDEKTSVYTVFGNAGQNLKQRLLFDFIKSCLPVFGQNEVDVSTVVHQLRRCKDLFEIDCIGRAIEVTTAGFDAATRVIAPGVLECEICASVVNEMIKAGCGEAFPGIVAAGRSATVLHYLGMDKALQPNDLVLIDIGAHWKRYPADITRVFPVSGKFSNRQREVYQIVLAAQRHVESLAEPGMFLRNEKDPNKSLHHLAVEFFKERGYEKYFVHGIGHFLGLDLHDVGDMSKELAVGDVFTIEPGIYLPEENLGIRIEDDYLITENGVECLSRAIPKDIEAVESWVSRGL
jgi:Xaa-Pro aminopeptidase